MGLRLVILPLLLVVVACDQVSSELEGGIVDSTSQEPLFVDVAPQTGLDFEHWNGMSGERYFVEPVGAGAGLLDVDDDGDLDVLLLQGRQLSGDEPSARSSDGARLYRNDLEPGQLPHFVDITVESGLRAGGYGMGVASGDFDNDGRVDFYITSFGSNQLWRNESEDGRIVLREVTAEAGVDDDRWSTSATFVDLDTDGWLDLFVANYVDFRIENNRICRSPGGRPDYCGPQSFNGEPDRLFRNRGDGTFEDITGSAGLLSAQSSGLGVVAADLDQDGWIDLYVANDLRRNFQWRNLGDESGLLFENIALENGTAVSSRGRAQASMGVVAGDLDNDGDDDLFMTHLSADTNTLYVNRGDGMFTDHSALSGLASPSLETTGFGTALIDVENDGWLDVMSVNGAVKTIEAQASNGDPLPLKEPNLLFGNRGDGTFNDISAAAGEEFARLEVSRGLAVGDVDNDGRSDALLSNNNGPARLLHNRSTSGNAWLGLRLLTRDGERDALGARVTIVRPDGSKLSRRVATDGSYLSAGDPRVLVGLGTDPTVEAVEVSWPNGETESFGPLEARRYHTLVAGQSRAASGSSEVIATWRSGSLERDDYENWREFHQLEDSPEAIRELVFVTTLAEISRTRGVEGELRTQLETEATTHKILLSALKKKVEDAASVSDTEIEAVLREHPEAFERPRKLRLSNIYKTLAEPDAGITRARMIELHQQLLEGADFEEMVGRESESQSRFRDGSLGFVDPEGLPPAVAAATRDLEPGQISEPVEHGEGISIFLCKEVRAGNQPTTEEVRAKVRSRLLAQRARKQWAEFQEHLLEDAKPVYSPSSSTTVLELPGYELSAEKLAELVALQLPTRTLSELAPPMVEEVLRRWAIAVLGIEHAKTIGLDREPGIVTALHWQSQAILARRELVRRVDQELREVSEEELQQYFDSHRRSYREPASYRLSVIHFGQGKDDRSQSAVERAVFVARRIETGEITFSAAAAEFSKHPSAAKGGDMGWVTRPKASGWGPTAAKALRQLKPGERSGLLRLESGLWLFELHDRRVGRAMDFESAREEVRANHRKLRIKELESAVKEKQLAEIELVLR